MSALYLSDGRKLIRSWVLYDMSWKNPQNTILPHIHYTNKQIPSLFHVLRTPHVFFGA
jgi:hypothetical protein